jgi:hypothetical protein
MVILLFGLCLRVPATAASLTGIKLAGPGQEPTRRCTALKDLDCVAQDATTDPQTTSGHKPTELIGHPPSHCEA